jgi:hypothetical protein
VKFIRKHFKSLVPAFLLFGLAFALVLPVVAHAAVDPYLQQVTASTTEYVNNNKGEVTNLYIYLGLVGLALGVIIGAVVTAKKWTLKAMFGGGRRRR